MTTVNSFYFKNAMSRQKLKQDSNKKLHCRKETVRLLHWSVLSKT